MSDDTLLQTEEAIIQGFLAPLAASAPGAHGLLDDCATALPSPGHEFVLKTDAIAEGVHFLPGDPPADIGWKAIAVNVSDLAAKGAKPVGYLMSLAFPEAPTRSWMADFARGLGEAQAAFGITLLGGDTDSRPGPISITPMVIGEVPIGCMVRRAAAQPGDVVYVSGTLGDAGLGLQLRREPSLADKWGLGPDLAEHLIQRFLRPQPRIALSPVVLAHARAAMDVSDGLLKDLGRMCRASDAGATVHQNALPLSEAFKAVRAADPAAADASVLAGDDYEILLTVDPARRFAMEAAARDAGVGLTPIGFVTVTKNVMLSDGLGHAIPVGRSGWDHF
ncbi:MAG: thiamine-phosphate kinase [Hyphomicrobium sp.]